MDLHGGLPQAKNHDTIRRVVESCIESDIADFGTELRDYYVEHQRVRTLFLVVAFRASDAENLRRKGFEQIRAWPFDKRLLCVEVISADKEVF